jgi:thioredoxin-related protein
MKKLLFILLCVSSFSFIKWQPDFETAKKIAREKHQLILLNFSGSDWCGPCIRLRKEIFESAVFSKMSDTSLVMVNADFPRNKKNQLDEQVRKQNEALADKYNPGGKFPLTLLLNPDGKIITSWDGLPGKKAEQFADQIRSICDVNK